MFDGLFGKLTSCFADRKENNLRNLNNYSLDYPDDQIDNNKIITLDNNPRFYIFSKIFQLISEGVSIYKVKHIFSINRVSLAILKYDSNSNSLIIISNKKDKEKILKVENIIEVIYGKKTSKFVLLSKKIEVVPWRCFSIIDKLYNTYDFICENDIEIFYILILLDIVINSEKYKKIDDYMKSKISLCSTVSRLYWKKVFLKIRYENSTEE